MEKREKLEIDIELKDLFFEFLRKWRLLVCCALIGGVVLGALSFVNSYKSMNTPSAPVVEETVEPTAQEVIDALTIDELPDVVAAVELKAQIDDKTEYLNESILMKIDPFKENRISLEYHVKSDDIVSVVSSYENFIANTSFGENVYETELVTLVANSASNVVVVEVIHVDAEQCERLAENVKDAWKTHSATLVRNGMLLEFQLLSETQSVVVDNELHQHQDAYLKECMDDQDTLAKMRADMNANQVSGYFHMWNAMYGEVEETENQGQEATDSVVQNTEPAKASVSMKQVLLGGVLGGVLAMVYVFVAYIMTGKLRTAEEVEKLYGVRLLGTMQSTSKKAANKEEIQLSAASICIQCQKYDTKEVYLSGSELADIPMELIEKIKAELKTNEIILTVGTDLTKDADALLGAASVGNVLLVEKKRVSAYKDMLKSVRMCENNHIRILGMLVIE